MMPSSGSTGPERGSGLRRWGPIAAIVAVVAIVAGVVVLGGGDDDDEAATTTSTAPPSSTGDTEGDGGSTLPEGAISFSVAEEQGLDVTFPDTCDTETGRVAIPYYYAPECFADVADNGGATAPGVTADTITIVVYVAPEQDAVLDFITAAIANDDTNEQVRETYQGYVDLLNATYQTYGRTVEVVFLEGSGQSQDEVSARADAVRAVEELGAFAVWGSPALNDAWSQELAARGVPCVGCFGLPEPDQNIFTTLPSNDQNRLILAEYMLTKLAGEPAEHAGDESLRGETRAFGHLYIETSQASVDQADELQADLEAGGSGFTDQRAYTLDPARLQEQATPIISGFKEQGITTIVVQGDPIAMATFTQEATAQEYFPEWVIGPSTLIDTAAFGRTYDQAQWSNAFGLSPLPARVDPQAEDTLYEWFFGQEAPANDSEAVISPNPLIFFNALQFAGPNLTVDSFREGMYARAAEGHAISAVSFTFGDQGLFPGLSAPDQAGIDDWTEIWWDAEATGPDELDREGAGLYRYVDGGTRFFVGEITEELRVFEEEGSITIYDEVPPADAERIGTYDPPS
jgi:hypothetical protein